MFACILSNVWDLPDGKCIKIWKSDGIIYTHFVHYIPKPSGRDGSCKFASINLAWWIRDKLCIFDCQDSVAELYWIPENNICFWKSEKLHKYYDSRPKKNVGASNSAHSKKVNNLKGPVCTMKGDLETQFVSQINRLLPRWEKPKIKRKKKRVK